MAMTYLDLIYSFVPWLPRYKNEYMERVMLLDEELKRSREHAGKLQRDVVAAEAKTKQLEVESLSSVDKLRTEKSTLQSELAASRAENARLEGDLEKAQKDCAAVATARAQLEKEHLQAQATIAKNEQQIKMQQQQTETALAGKKAAEAEAEAQAANHSNSRASEASSQAEGDGGSQQEDHSNSRASGASSQAEGSQQEDVAKLREEHVALQKVASKLAMENAELKKKLVRKRKGGAEGETGNGGADGDHAPKRKGETGNGGADGDHDATPPSTPIGASTDEKLPTTSGRRLSTRTKVPSLQSMEAIQNDLASQLSPSRHTALDSDQVCASTSLPSIAWQEHTHAHAHASTHASLATHESDSLLPFPFFACWCFFVAVQLYDTAVRFALR